MTDMQIDGRPIKDSEKIELAMYASAPLGLGAMIGGILIGWVLDKYGPVVTVHLINAVSTLALIIMIIFNEVDVYWLAYITSFMLGLMDASQITFIHIAMGFEFDNKITPFAAQKLT